MNHSNGLLCGEDIDLQFDLHGERLIYTGRVNEIEDGIFSIRISDKDLPENRIPEGGTAVLLGQNQSRKISFPVRIESTDNLPFVLIKENNSRSHVRADGFAKLSCLPLAEKLFSEKREQYLNEIPTDYFLEDPDSGNSYRPEDNRESNPDYQMFMQKISRMNKRLNALQKLIFNSEEVQVFEQKPMKVNLSGSGMKISWSNGLNVGDLLDIKMVLPTSPFIVIKAIGLAIRVDQSSGYHTAHAAPSQQAAVKFLAIHEDHREAIIRCVFTWQRKHARAKKSNFEDRGRPQ
ncbi:hypothetical protein ACFL9T_15845 [Thermodesulfobacteriota bacterium]